MKLTILGASGHGKVIADIASLNGYDEIVFLDDNMTLKSCGTYPVVGKTSLVGQVYNDVFIAMGNVIYRRMFMERFKEKSFPVLIHPSAVIAKDAIIGGGTVVMAGAVINPCVKIGQGCIVNTCASVDHDCVLEQYVHVSVGAHLCGAVAVGENTWVGAGAILSNNVEICSNCTIGAGSVVIKDIKSPGTYVGVPARRIYEWRSAK